MTLEQAINIAKFNGAGEARRRMGMDYTKVVPIPRTISESVDLAMNHERLGLTGEELHKVFGNDKK